MVHREITDMGEHRSIRNRTPRRRKVSCVVGHRIPSASSIERASWLSTKRRWCARLLLVHSAPVPTRSTSDCSCRNTSDSATGTTTSPPKPAPDRETNREGAHDRT